MRVAVIDCGTNTFNLLIADFQGKEYDIIHSSKVAVKIGKGGINNCQILPDAMDRAMKALIHHRMTINEFGADKILVFATSAVRSADNGNEFIERARAEADLDVTVISGEREAELIYEGVKHSGSLTNETCLIMDIGGGSCEFIICNQEKAFDRFSFEIGVSRLIDKFNPSDPMTEAEAISMRTYLDHTLVSLFEKTAKYNPQYLVGSSGTFDTFTDLLLAAQGHVGKKPNEFSYTVNDFNEIHDKILMSTLEERLKIPGMAAFRAEMITASVIAVKSITDHYKFLQIKSSAFSLKEGMLFALRDGKI
jgi:exopolyphosphatase/guanosine-5'-triphosphate,3'-diphosphate pyrophosphatase